MKLSVLCGDPANGINQDLTVRAQAGCVTENKCGF